MKSENNLVFKGKHFDINLETGLLLFHAPNIKLFGANALVFDLAGVDGDPEDHALLFEGRQELAEEFYAKSESRHLDRFYSQGWKLADGQSEPVAYNELVDVRYRIGLQSRCKFARLHTWVYSHDSDYAYDVIAYRLS